MVQRGEDVGFALETGHALRIVGDIRRKDLQRDLALQHHVNRAIHLAHAASAELFGYLVGAKPRARSECHA
jgi:hypothetical protein